MYRYKHYKSLEDSIILNIGVFFQNYYGETGIVKYHQLLMKKKLLNEVLRNIHGEFSGLTESPKQKYLPPELFLPERGTAGQVLGYVM